MKKTFTDVVIKDASQGLVEAVFSRFDVVDKDGDITDRGAFTEGAAVVISAYGHKSWDGELPVGHGTIHEQGDVAVMRGQFLMNTTHGRDTFETVKALSAAGIQEWSYSLHEVQAEPDTVDGKRVRRIKKVGLVKEVSPVLRGAGVDTLTLATKQARKQLVSSIRALLTDAGRMRWPEADWLWLVDVDVDAGFAVFLVEEWSDTEDTYVASHVQVDFTRTDTAVVLGDTETEVHPTTVFLPKTSKFAECSATALGGVKALVEMATQRLAQRADQGKAITEQISVRDQLVAELAPLNAAIDQATNHPSDDLQREYARFVAISQGVLS